jgi:hypothetical protein
MLKDQYAIFLDDDLLLRGLSIDGSDGERQERLKQARLLEWTYKRLLEALTYHDAKKDLRILNLM